MPNSTPDPVDGTGLHQPVVAGVVTALVGFTSSFAVVLAGLHGVGASDAQAASGLLSMTCVFAVIMMGLALWTRTPLTLAWSTPGAALLATTGSVHGGWPAAVGAFVLTGVLIAATGVIAPLGRAAAAVPVPLAQAMLAGVLLELCLAPFTALAAHPWAVAPVILAWLAAMRWLPRWAVPIALAVALVVIAISLMHAETPVAGAHWWPRLTLTTPQLSLEAVTAIALPLTVVTMASQNVPGVAVMRSFGFAVPWRASMIWTGLGTAATAPFGTHAINLAALSAALAAGDGAGERSRRWVASISAGVTYLVLAAASGALVELTSLAPSGIVETVAGLALLGSFTAAILGAVSDERHRRSSAIAFLVAGSGLQLAGIGGAFWAIVAGLVVRWWLERAPATSG